MPWPFFPFSFFQRKSGARPTHGSDEPYSATEEYVSRFAAMPLPMVAAIYRAGKPWPVSLDDFDRVARREAEALNCSLNEARQIVLKRLQWQKVNAEGDGRAMDTTAYATWHRHRQRIARKLGENLELVTKIHHGVLKYRWQEGKQPD